MSHLQSGDIVKVIADVKKGLGTTASEGGAYLLVEVRVVEGCYMQDSRKHFQTLANFSQKSGRIFFL